MKKIFKIVPALVIVGFLIVGFTSAETKPVKCMIQMTNYTGEGAYIIVSLMNTKGEYEETLQVLGKDQNGIAK